MSSAAVNRKGLPPSPPPGGRGTPRSRTHPPRCSPHPRLRPARGRAPPRDPGDVRELAKVGGTIPARNQGPRCPDNRSLMLSGDSCGHLELARRDADEALEGMGELALIREAGARRDLCHGDVAPSRTPRGHRTERGTREARYRERGAGGGARWHTRRAGLRQMAFAEGGGLMIPFGRGLRMARPPAPAFFVRAVGRSKKCPRLPGSARPGRRCKGD